ncbi:DUF7832 domain-containing protein [Prosthecobacter vanneervenii]|uniref:DUF7832 domain-containing protein n=1 Tax=Prosthecobacter vanneervenii TaxID=48466 RepID=A0A7W8DJ28_9BACT|nr:hypothetical protein [Prosthecobacter vanneervenii]MBB5031416.1 hypothetical protein [Prosthecobacter vanneervenii]
MNQPKVYDKAKWHFETVDQHGLPEEHASHHIVFFFRWCIENDFVSEWLRTEWPEDYAAVRDGQLSALDYFEKLDLCLIDDMLTDEGNAFASAYFEYETGRYIDDLLATLKGDLPSEYHIPFNEDTYGRLRQVMDSRYAAWKTGNVASVSKKRKWWQFWK